MIVEGGILAGVDYDYWRTFNLQLVFPGLQDKFYAFPAATVYNQLVKDWRTLNPGKTLFSQPDLINKINTLYGAYLLALSKGATPYELHPATKPPFATASFMVQQTGIDRGTTVAFLTELEALAKAGKIDFKYWNPDRAVQLNTQVKKVQAALQASQPKSPVASAVESAASGLKWGGIGILTLAAGAVAWKIFK